MNIDIKLQRLAEKAGATLVKKANDHYQIQGGLLVNYYPKSKKRTVYIAGTTIGKHHVTPEEAVAMAFKAPSNPKIVKKRVRQTHKRRSLFKKIKNCHWCKVLLTLDIDQENSATVEHIIPLSRGGLNNKNNLTLACFTCNHDRGNNMPELDDQQRAER